MELRTPFLAALVFLLAAAAPSRSSPVLQAAASTAFLADLLRQVAGEDVEVTALSPPGSHPRRGGISGEALRKAARGALYIRIGDDLEGKADRELRDGASAGPFVLDLSAGIRLLRESPEEEAERKIFSAALGVDGGAPRGSPYFWLDPREASRIVDRMEGVLSDHHPEGAEGYRTRAAHLKSRLEELDGEIRRSLPEDSAAPFITFSGAWGYFARRYGLKVVPAAGLTPGGGPGRHSLSNTSARILSLGAGAVFTDLTFPQRPAEEAAAAAGVRLVVLEPFGAPGRDGYFEMMRWNLHLIAAEISPR